MDCTMMAAASCMIMNNNNMMMMNNMNTMAATNNTNYHRPAITARNNKNHGPRINNMNREPITNNTNNGEPPVRSSIVSSAPDEIILLLITVAVLLAFMIVFDALSIGFFQLYIEWYFIIFYCVDALMLLMLFIYICSTCCIRPKLGILKVGFILTGIFFFLHIASITTVGIMCDKMGDGKNDLESFIMELQAKNRQKSCYYSLIFPGFNVFFMLSAAIVLYIIISKYQVSKKATNSQENNNNDNRTV